MKVRLSCFSLINVSLWLLCAQVLPQAEDRPQGFAMLPVPSLTYSNGEGVEYGGKLFAFQFGHNAQSPYLWHGVINYTRTTKQKTDFYLFVDVPHWRTGGPRVDLRLEYKNLRHQDFYGLGNQPLYNPAFLQKRNPQFQSTEYYSYQQHWRALMLNVQWPLAGKKWRLLGGLGLFHYRIASHPQPTLFQQTEPFGAEGGYSNYLRVGIIHDTRDQEAVAQRGAWSEILLEPAWRLFGNKHSYLRLTAIDRRYFLLHPRLVWAQRVIAEAMPGSPPFYEMAVLSNSYQRHVGLGGALTLRGQPRLLYVGPNKLLANLELRWRVLDMSLWKQGLTYYLHTFSDIGRVWMNEERFSLRQLHFAEGIGIHVQWKKEFVAVLDIGRSRFQDYAFYFGFGNLF